MLFKNWFFQFVALMCAMLSVSSITPTTVEAACWENLTRDHSKKETFVLAIGLNTGELTQAVQDAKKFVEAVKNYSNIDQRYVCLVTNSNDLNFTDFDFVHTFKLSKIVGEEDTVIIYFSGHGTVIPVENTNNCVDQALVTFLLKDNKVNGYIIDNKFVESVNKIKTDNIITIIDSCFSGGMVRGDGNCTTAKSKLIINSENYPDISCPDNGLDIGIKGVLYSASDEFEDAYESPEQGGLFTDALVTVMKNNREKNWDGLFELAKETVFLRSKQMGCPQNPQRIPAEE